MVELKCGGKYFMAPCLSNYSTKTNGKSSHPISLISLQDMCKRHLPARAFSFNRCSGGIAGTVPKNHQLVKCIRNSWSDLISQPFRTIFLWSKKQPFHWYSFLFIDRCGIFAVFPKWHTRHLHMLILIYIAKEPSSSTIIISSYSVSNLTGYLGHRYDIEAA